MYVYIYIYMYEYVVHIYIYIERDNVLYVIVVNDLGTGEPFLVLAEHVFVSVLCVLHMFLHKAHA